MTDNSRRVPYKGSVRKLVVSIDVGTTFTAASFCILQPGQVPKFEEVLRWPKQVNPDAKVPSVLYYDKTGKAKAFGAETEDEDTIINAEENGWYKSEWWKLHLRPSHLPIIRDLALPPLPTKVTVEDIFAHHLEYIKNQLQEYITATYGEGGTIWSTLSPSMYVVLTTPNGWEGVQQNRMRQAAIKAGLVDIDGGRRVRFVTEAEAAVLYAIDSGSVGDWLVNNGHLILCDCGGGTIDITGYTINSVKPLRLAESSASRCYLAGAVFVTQAAKTYLKKHLKGTEWDNEDSIQRIVYHFDRNAKRKFDDPTKPSYVQLDGHKTDPKLGIIRGKLKISGANMASFFSSSLNSITEGLEIAFENGGRLADKIILVGGLASSPYIYSELVKWGNDFGVSVSRPDGPTIKAVANGALAWHIDARVASRVAKYHYGITVGTPFSETDTDQVGRRKYQAYNGEWRVNGSWSAIVNKNDNIVATKEFISPFWRTFTDDDSKITEEKIYVYRRAAAPKYITFPGKNTLHPGFEVICKIKGDLGACYLAAPYETSKVHNTKYKTIYYNVCISLGETEIAARMSWLQNDVLTYGEAEVAYD